MNEDLHWFCGRRTLINDGVYMRPNGGAGSKVVFSLPMWFCILGYIGIGV